MNRTFTDWLKEVSKNKRILTINHGWGKPEREFHFWTKKEVIQNWGEISRRPGSLIETINLYSDIDICCSLFPWQYIIVEVAGTSQGDSKRKAFISNRTLLLHYITSGHMEFYNKDIPKSSIFPDGVDPLRDTMVFIPEEIMKNIIEDKEKTFGVSNYNSIFGC
jgi:hypothetical protein